MAYRVNAGPLPRDHWTNDLARGGGRLKGEGCHFIDFLCDQAGSDPVTVSARGFASRPDLPLAATDNFSVEIGFADGGGGHAPLRGRRAGRPRQGAVRDQLARRLRGARGLPARAHLARPPEAASRGRAPGQGLRGAVQVPRRACAREDARPRRPRASCSPPSRRLRRRARSRAGIRRPSCRVVERRSPCPNPLRDRRWKPWLRMAVSPGDREDPGSEVERLAMEARGSMSIQPGERERARFDVPGPDHDRGSGTFGQALQAALARARRDHWRARGAGDRVQRREDTQLRGRDAVGGRRARMRPPRPRSRASPLLLSSSLRPTAAPCRATRWSRTWRRR